VGESGKTTAPASFDAVTALGRPAAPAPKVDLAAIVAQYRAAMARDQGAPTVFDLLGVGDGEGAGAPLRACSLYGGSWMLLPGAPTDLPLVHRPPAGQMDGKARFDHKE
jgi:hypothetical protein